MSASAIAMLRSLEWSGKVVDLFAAQSRPACPSCDAVKDNGWHQHDCALAEFLAAVEAPMDAMVLAEMLCSLAVRGSPDRKTASVRLMAAAATLAVTEGADLKQWMGGTISTYDMMKKAHKADRAGVRRIAGLGIVEAVKSL